MWFSARCLRSCSHVSAPQKNKCDRCRNKRECVHILFGNEFVIRSTSSLFFCFFPANWFSSLIKIVRLFAESLCLHVRCCAECMGYWTRSVCFVFVSLASSSSSQPTVPSNARNSRLHILKLCLGLPSRSVDRIDRLFIKGGGGVRWRRGESRAEWQVVGKRWVSHWLTRWKLNTGPRLVSQQESVGCLGASAQFIGHTGTLHLPSPRLIHMDFRRLIPDLSDACVLLI